MTTIPRRADLLALAALLLLAGCGTNRYYISILSSSQNDLLKQEAIQYFGEHCVKRAVPVLSRVALDKSQSIDIRRKAVWALAQIRDAKATKDLLPLAAEKEMVPNLLVLFANTKSKDSVPLLIEMAATPGDVQLAVIWALGKIGDKRAVPILTRLSKDADKYVVYNATQALKRIRYAEYGGL